ncbi:Ig-like domain-containing protein [Mycobacterium sp. AMU20-3851]|uniref:Ig-like domain-containing protein n=1 Tax=Mycobacterium sp. AMU20-3851 TaxID=3122055 RepID=UPI003754B82F
MTATLWGLSVVGPDIGVASAEDGTSSSSTGSDSGPGGTDSAGSTTSGASAPSASPDHTSERTARPTAPRSVKSADDDDAETELSAPRTTTTDHADEPAVADDEPTETGPEPTEPPASTAPVAPEPEPDRATDTPRVRPTSATGAHTAADATARELTAAAPTGSAAEAVGQTLSSTETVTPPRSVVVSVGAPDPRRQAIADQIAALMTTYRTMISMLPVAQPVKTWMYESLAGTRRTLFNQAPWLTPVQISGTGDGPIIGTLGAVDLEGDAIRYIIVTGPTSGTLLVDEQGVFTYTPGTGFNGVDNFVIAAKDIGTHVNLFDPFRGASSSASLLVNQNAVSFVFNYLTGAQYWTTDARNALQRAASTLVTQFIVKVPVVVTYDITGHSTASSFLASADSPLTSSSPGFHPTVVQYKLQTGLDANGVAADGTIDWNFAYPWAFGDYVTGSQYDFSTVAMHEFLHSFGLMSYVEPGAIETRRTWTIYDSLLQSSDGTRLIGTDFRLNTALSSNLQGGNGGLFFGGEHAVAASGGPAAVYTPSTWAQGSSLSHLSNAAAAGADRSLTSPRVPLGPGPRTLTATERGLMQDLGYTLTPLDATSVLAFIGFVFIRRRRPADVV